VGIVVFCLLCEEYVYVVCVCACILVTNDVYLNIYVHIRAYRVFFVLFVDGSLPSFFL